MSTYTGSFIVPSGDSLTVQSGGTISVPGASIAGTALTNDSVVGAQLAAKAVSSQIGWANVVDFGADATGATDSSIAFNSAQTAAAASNAWVFVPPGTFKIASSPTYTEPFFISAGAQLQPTSGNTIIFGKSATTKATSAVLAPLTQIFGGAGNIDFAYGTDVFPEWWGALGNVGAVNTGNVMAATDDGSAIRSAIAAISSAGGTVRFQPRGYAFTGTIDVTASHVVLRGAGMNVTVLCTQTPGTGTGITFSGVGGYATTSTSTTSPGSGTVFNVPLNPVGWVAVGDEITVDNRKPAQETCSVTAVSSTSITVLSTSNSHTTPVITDAPKFLANCGVYDLSLYQLMPGSSGEGLSLYYTTFAILERIQVFGFFGGITLQRATSSQITKVGSTYNTTSPSAGFIGFSVNGNAEIVNNLYDVGGNNATIIRDCFVDVSPIVAGEYAQVSVNSIGLAVFGSYTSDLWIDQFNTSYAYVGISIDQSAAWVGNESMGDTRISQCVPDLFNLYGIFVKGRPIFSGTATNETQTGYGTVFDFSTLTSGSVIVGDQILVGTGANQEQCQVTAVTPGTPGSITVFRTNGPHVTPPISDYDGFSTLVIRDGWFDPYTSTGSSASPSGVYIENGARGVAVEGAQFYTGGNPFGQPIGVGVYVSNAGAACQNVTVSGCKFVGQNYGVIMYGTGQSTIVGNSFYNPTSNNEAAYHIQLALTPTDVTVIGNSFDGYVTNNAIYLDATVQGCSFIGNSFSSSIASKAFGLTSGQLYNWIEGSPGYNPVGTITAPAFPTASPGAVNGQAVAVTAYASVTSGSLGTVHILDPGASSYTTIAWPAMSGAFRLPPGAKIYFSGSGSGAGWVWIGD